MGECPPCVSSEGDRDRRQGPRLGGVRHEVEAQPAGFTVQAPDGSLAGLLLVEVLAGVDVLGLVLEHGVDDACEFVGGGGDGLGFAEAGAHAAVVGAEGALAVDEALGSHAEGSGGAVLGFLGFGSDDFAAGFVVVGAEAEPGGEVLDGGPGGHIDAGFGEDFVDGEGVEAGDLGEVDASEKVEVEAEVEGGGILFGLAAIPLAGLEGLAGGVGARLEGGVTLF